MGMSGPSSASRASPCTEDQARNSAPSRLSLLRQYGRILIVRDPSARIVGVRPGSTLIVRSEYPGESSFIHEINKAAFDRTDEADLVDGLRADGAVLLSLVAELERQIVGHVLFSRMWIDEDGRSVPAVALAPVAVLPGHQRRGIGERLIRKGLDCLREQHEQIVLVLGNPDYYSRFGFSNENARSLESPFPPEAFMALELVPRALNGVRGKVRYPAAFGV